MSKAKLIRQKMIKDGYKVSNNGAFEHRRIFEEQIGKIPKKYVVHHIDCNKDNNDPQNLIALPRLFHRDIHIVMRRNRTIFNRDILSQYLIDYKKMLKEDSIKISKLTKEKKRLTCLLQDVNRQINIMNYRKTDLIGFI